MNLPPPCGEGRGGGTEDHWTRWITYGRQGGPSIPPDLLQKLHRVRDRVLEQASIVPGDVVLDVGCGDGLIGFGALDRVGERGRVIFSDISPHLVARCNATAARLGVLPRCDFMVAPATELDAIPQAGVDVVVTRSVLIYVDDKPRAFSEFFRVLRSGGRLSIGEPINQFVYPEPPGVFCGYEVSPVQDIAEKLEAFFKAQEGPRIVAMMDFNEWDLVLMVERTGFRDIHLDFEVDIRSTAPEPWDRFMRRAGNPLSPTMEAAFVAALTPVERDRFTAHLKPLVESGAGTERRAFAFLSARKPAG